MKNVSVIMLLLIGLSTLPGCSTENKIEMMKTKPSTYILIESNEEVQEPPLNYVVVPKAETLSVLYDVGADYEDFKLDEYSVTEKIVTLGFNDQEVTLTSISEQQYEDANGNVYELSIVSDEE
ncbi:hypothetical protein [Alkalibacterium kapii]|uniref:Uncharacterized protein n=1 Tax=Alkalibacterium kapii TaxID=426704 RepID=A0A511ATP0_9LACT|nr:hypothetical protein [Alkalibacterium kapii]GEK90693.1 hypothetical protein AKA01nite_03150 [Alkalibacterium kapii]